MNIVGNSNFKKLVIAAFIAPIAVLALPAVSVAQDEVVEEIIVTGSHIRKDTFSSSSPISVLDSSTIEGVGATNIGDLIARVPSVVSAVDGSSANVNEPSNSGLNTTALRNLGSSRTLVLLNGRRYVSGTGAGAGYGVDLNTLPTTMIERVEVLTGAQSAAYGSDAVAGVINIITKTDFDGVRVHAQVGQASEGDRKKEDIDLTVGHNFSDGNIWFSVGYSNDDGLQAVDRENSAFSRRSIDTTGDGLFDSLAFEGSSHVPGARLIAGGLSLNGDGTPFDGGRDLATTDRLNFNEFRSILIPLERRFASTGMTLDVSEKATVTFEANYARVESRARFEPIPLSVFGDVYKLFKGGTSGMDLTTHPLWVGSSAGDQIVAAGVTNFDGFGNTFRRTVELGGRGSGNIRDTLRTAIALDYELDNGMYLDIYGTYGVTDQVQTDFGDINLERALLALDMEADGFGGYQCVDEIARIQGCVPFNPFGTTDSLAGQAGITGISPEAAEYLAAAVGLTGNIEQTVVAAVLSGDLPFSIADQDSAAFAFGLEYREERGQETPDGLRQKGITRGYNIQPTKGNFNVLDVFGEIQLPISDMFTLDAAVRAGDYSSVGSTFTWKVGLDAAINDSFRFRAATSTAVRAPNVTDLFGGAFASAALSFDPCNGVDLTTTGNTAENCRSIDAIMTRIVNDGSFALTQVEGQNTTTFSQGSPTVQEEEADSFTIGAIFTPTGLEGLSIALDYYSIKIEDAIRVPSGTDVLNRCHDVASATFDPTCGGLVFRSPTFGPVLDVRATANNEDTIETTGIDLEASYLFDDLGGGDLLIALGANFLAEYDVTGSAGDKQDLQGEVLFPETRFNVTLDYNIGDFNVFSQLRFRGETKDRNDNTIHTDALNDIDSVTYVDLRGSYRINDSISAYVGANNLFDETPPAMGFTHKYFQQAVNTNGTAFDTVGRQWYAGITATF
jgi:iron complex outermembrane receptor protein